MGPSHSGLVPDSYDGAIVEGGQGVVAHNLQPGSIMTAQQVPRDISGMRGGESRLPTPSMVYYLVPATSYAQHKRNRGNGALHVAKVPTKWVVEANALFSIYFVGWIPGKTDPAYTSGMPFISPL